MAKRYYGRKIKRSRKNLYHQRKSGFRTFLEIFGMIVLVGGLVFVGYAAGQPLIEFFKGGGATVTSESLEWKPEESQTTTAPVATTTPEVTTTPEPEKAVAAGTMTLAAPTSALANTSALEACLAAAKNDGYNSVSIELKNETGQLLYKSTIAAVKDTEIVAGTLTLKEIKASFDKLGITPVVTLNTVYDRLAPKFIDGVSYRWADDSYAWLDATAENGGKQWANPFNTATVNYIGSLTREISNAGFETIILSNTIFPEWKPFDTTIMAAELQDTATRYKALTKLVTTAAGKADKAVTAVEVDMNDLLASYNGYVGTAEILRGAAELTDISVVITFDRADFGAELVTGVDSSVKLPADLASLVKNLYTRALKYTGSLKAIPCIEADGMSDEELKIVTDTLKSMDFAAVFVK